MAHDAPGEPGRGSMLMGEGDLLIGLWSGERLLSQEGVTRACREQDDGEG